MVWKILPFRVHLDTRSLGHPSYSLTSKLERIPFAQVTLLNISFLPQEEAVFLGFPSALTDPPGIPKRDNQEIMPMWKN